MYTELLKPFKKLAVMYYHTPASLLNSIFYKSSWSYDNGYQCIYVWYVRCSKEPAFSATETGRNIA